MTFALNTLERKLTPHDYAFIPKMRGEYSPSEEMEIRRVNSRKRAANENTKELSVSLLLIHYCGRRLIRWGKRKAYDELLAHRSNMSASTLSGLLDKFEKQYKDFL